MFTFMKTKDMKHAGTNSLNESLRRGAIMCLGCEEESKSVLKVKVHQPSISQHTTLQATKGKDQ